MTGVQTCALPIYVNTISSLVDLISIQRNYANAQKVLTVLDGIRSTITNELGKQG